MEKPAAVLTHLSGTFRGKTERPPADRLRVGPRPDSEIKVHAKDLQVSGDDDLAVLERKGEAFELRAAPEAGVYVNGQKVEYVVLDSGDLVEIGPGGPALRFRMYQPDSPNKSVRDAVSDCIDCARYSGRNPLHRALIFLAGAPRELATQTTLLFRVAVSVVLVLLIGIVGFLWYQNTRLEDRLAAGSEKVLALKALLERAEETGFGVDDLEQARVELSETMLRVEALEERQSARMRIIAEAGPSVVFLQGGYGFEEEGGGRPLRFVDPSEIPAPKPLPGAPFFSFEGSGPELEITYTGTAFIVSDEGYLLTNRHVAVPWEFDESAGPALEMKLKPVMRRFLGFLPAISEPLKVELVRPSDTQDVALLHFVAPPDNLSPLPLSDEVPAAGDEVIVMGYPTGMQALIARTDQAFIDSLNTDEDLDFWKVALMLSSGGHIAPLATAGVVGQVTGAKIVYDAETTHGGSGGPVLDLQGRVVAVNTAIIPEFGGSNLGVPAAEAKRLMGTFPE